MADDEVETEGKSACLSDGYTVARFASELGLPRAEEAIFTDAKTAVRQEFRDCSKWKRL